MNKNLKPFDLERALAGDPVITRDGRSVQEIHHFKYDKSEWCVGVVIDGGYWRYCMDGSTCRAYNSPEGRDLFMAPIEKEYWIVTYMGTTTQNIFSSGCLFHTEQLAKNWIKSNGGIQFGQPQIHKITRLE